MAVTDTTKTTTKPDTTTTTPPVTPPYLPPPVRPPSPQPPAAVSYIALGDSYTKGEAIPTEDSFPYQLAALLGKDYGLQKPLVIAQTGWTSDELIYQINASGYITVKYEIVTLLIGVNDQYRGISKDEYRKNFIHLVNQALDHASGRPKRVFVISIPDYGVTPFANGQGARIGAEIDQFNAINKEESDKAGVNYINITPISKQAATDQTLTANDGLHPSAKMYTEWVKLLAPRVVEQIKVP
ncbi:SGNH/GDSL hydrolase family protein [Mucilaginibacter myungsuensis]|uniref:SGNH/GDSL hydrolase family protein n=1 Tax=Mucilaginibacter myungsuensis TaxID=649104 RepID=UPI0025B3E02C|nr:SGNH/GDSL hydrolase family protein [Mucilaginibacter myungsuensis]MDN3600161.1 SGNH/GDSL hydrolase family protein [Mucilaginibacter myungsuensis]